ncbi:MAG: hypothetical protein EPN84_13600 [Legionella sp.]|nr:MAG: hypothetical protein EPN84_13600 [Legionella sp.]
MNKAIPLVLLLSTWPMLSSAAVYKCIKKDGSTSYQNTACEDLGKATRIYSTEELRQIEARKHWDAQRALEPELKRGWGCYELKDKSSMVGLTGEQLKAACGRPSDVNTSGTSSGLREQDVYRLTGPTTIYYYLVNDQVRSWSSH